MFRLLATNFETLTDGM